MITLITGAPGAGKSAALVKLLSELAKARPVFVDGVPELKVDHQPLHNPREWMTTVPDGAVVVIDEVQRVWRPSGAGAKVPEDIAALETHRHRGLDFYIVTQHPKLLHSNVRNLVGRHVHLRDIGVLGRWWYEWPEAADPSSWRTAPVKRRYRMSKAHLALYRSATEHIKPIRSVPPVLYVLGGSLVALGVLGWFTYQSVSSKTAPSAQPSAAPAPGASSLPSFGGSAAPVAPSWPRYELVPHKAREPYEGRALRIEGEYTLAGVHHAVFGIIVEGQRVASVTLAQLVSAGYRYTSTAPCSGVLRWRDGDRLVTCGAPAPIAGPGAAASAPSGQQSS